MHRIIVALLIVAGALACDGVYPGGGRAIATDLEPRLMLAPTGVLRAGLYPGTPTSILPDAESSEPRGVGYDLGKALARQLGVPYEPVVFAKNAEVLAAVKNGEVDVAFTNATAVRARDMDFGPPFLEIELGYLVPRGSTLTAPAEVDAAGLRVGVTTGSSSDAALSRDFKHAQIVRAATFDVAIEMMTSGAIEAYATNKAALFEIAEKLPGSKVLEGKWGIERHAIAIPKGREQALAFIRQFTNEVKSNGTVAAAIARAGLQGATVPAAD